MLKEVNFSKIQTTKPILVQQKKFNDIQNFNLKEIKVQKYNCSKTNKPNKQNQGWKFDPICKAWNPAVKLNFQIPKPQPTSIL